MNLEAKTIHPEHEQFRADDEALVGNILSMWMKQNVCRSRHSSLLSQPLEPARPPWGPRMGCSAQLENTAPANVSDVEPARPRWSLLAQAPPLHSKLLPGSAPALPEPERSKLPFGLARVLAKRSEWPRQREETKTIKETPANAIHISKNRDNQETQENRTKIGQTKRKLKKHWKT